MIRTCIRIFVSFWFLSFQASFGAVVWKSQSVQVAAKPGDLSVSAHFDFVNAGDTEVQISRILTSCGCTMAEATKEVFLPQEKGSIRVLYHLGDESGKREVSINVEGPGMPERGVILKMIVNIPVLVKVTPARLAWEAGENPVSKIATAQIISGVPLHLIKASSSDLRLAVKLIKSELEGQYLVSVQPKSTSDVMRAVVSLESDYPKEKPRRFSFYVWIK